MINFDLNTDMAAKTAVWAACTVVLALVSIAFRKRPLAGVVDHTAIDNASRHATTPRRVVSEL